ncbi:MAG: Zn-dependent peptidase [Homavirus sp.]|uniref:Zn-dependent peptidase n=1 Tax=Homavirus sp. TaxID=2487769 RepID=A0A3G5A9V6_9VIRU|nr:MAG: Zn-dependent peptidase [Homavirus sp.]
MDIIKSKQDKREYKYKILDNDLEVIIVYDPTTTLSGASMNVNIGYYYDPPDYNGLAHFLEHMLFMGTQKYKSENHFMDFLNKHGGSTNAYTTTESTNYHFDIQSEYFHEALDIFGQFFINPLFKKKRIIKELNAVDSEHSKNINNDGWRLNRMLNLIVDKQHPNSTFGTGSLKTLMKPNIGDIRNRLLQFYNEYYSSNLMKLVVYSNLKPKKMIDVVESIFSHIKNKNTHKLKYNIQQFNFSKKLYGIQCYKLIKMIPINDENRLNIFWQFPNLKKYYDSKPLDYIAHLLGHEGEGSIYYCLDKMGWIMNIYCGNYIHDETTILLGLHITLTKNGFKYVPTIIDTIYDYINHILKDGIKKWLYDEQKKIGQINFDYLSKIDTLDYVTNLSINMYDYPISHILYGPYYYKDYDSSVEDIITTQLLHLKKDESIVIICSKYYKNKTVKTDEIYNMKYLESINVKDYGPEFSMFDNNIQKLQLPVKNIFIPTDLSILPPIQSIKFPEMIKLNNIQIWYKKDNQFNVPKILMDVIIYNSKIYSKLKNFTKCSLFIRCLNKKMQSMAYYAMLANSSFSIDLDNEFIKFNINSYNDSINTIIDYLIKTFLTFTIDKAEYDIVVEDFKSDLNNIIYEPPRLICNEYMKEKIYNNYYNFMDILKSVDSVDYHQIKKVNAWFKENCFIRCLVQGNIYKNDVLSLISKYKPFICGEQPIDRLLLNKLNTIDLGSEEIYIRKTFNPKEPDSVIYIIFEVDNIKAGVTEDWNKKISFLLLINEILNEMFFNQLRTKQQLGYIVRSKIKSYGNIEYPLWGYSFLIQSSKYDPNELRLRIKNFVNKSGEYITSMSDVVFEKYKSSIIGKLLTPDNNLFDEYNKNLNEILTTDYIFNKNIHYADYIKNMTKNEIYEMYNLYFLDRYKRKIRIVELYSKNLLKKIDN